MSSVKRCRSFMMRDQEAWREFTELCRREGVSASEKIEEFIAQYVKIHYPGNPQLHLGKYLNPPAPKTVCPDGERGWCPTSIDLCVKRVRYACKFKEA